MTRWNRVIKKAGFDFEMRLPSERFNRRVGMWAGGSFGVDGAPANGDALAAALPSEADRAYVKSLMVPVRELGKFASWIAPPDRGVNGQSIDFEYVRGAAA
jgi:benzoyl-CoA 2,3-dioxygenase component B